MTKEVRNIIKSFEKRGYQVKQVSKPWRSTVAIVEKNAILFVLKIVQSNDKTINPISDHSKIVTELQNQAVWDREVSQLLEGKNIPVKVPKVFESHFSANLGYILEEYVAGEKITNFTKWLPSIVETLHFFNTQKIAKLKLPLSEVSAYDWLIDRINKWSKEPLDEGAITSKQMAVVYQIVEDAKELLHFKLQHGDFSPGHLFDYHFPVFGLIDDEKGGINKPAFYDAAYFYPKLYVNLGNQKIAKQFLKQFREGLKENADDFGKQFMALLTARAIGGIRDYIVQDKKLLDERDFERREQFFKLCLRNDINLLI